MRLHAGLLLLAVAVIPISTPALAAWSHDTNAALEVAPTGLTQFSPAADTDGSGGLFVAWQDSRAGVSNFDIYLQRVTADGGLAPGWPATGLPVCTAGSQQNYPALISDGSGGCWVAWEDNRASLSDRDIYIQHVLGNGSLAPGFGVNGLKLATAGAKDESGVRLASDGAGGVYAAWTYVFSAPTDYDIYGAHLNAAGTVQFVSALDAAGNLQTRPCLIADGIGNAIIAYFNNDNAGAVGPLQIRYFKFGPGGAHLTGTTAVSTPVPTSGFPPQLVADNAGGAYLAFQAFSGSVDQFFVTRLNSAAAVMWGSNSLNTLDGTVNQSALVTCPDGAGGLIAAWSDNRSGVGVGTYALRILPSGYRAGGWPGTGVQIGAYWNGTYVSEVVPDGTGGAIAGWIDLRSASGEYYAARLNGAGVLVPGWNATGNPLSTAGTYGAVGALTMLPDGNGGVLAAFSFARGVPAQILAQNLDAFGQPGDNRPMLGRPRDVAADQGGKVRLTWNASWLDQPASLGIAQYWVWRQTPAAAAQAAVRNGAGRWEDGVAGAAAAVAPAAGTHLFRSAGPTNALYAWEYLAALGTNGSAQYSYVAATVSDSMTGHNPYTTFMVEARGAATGAFWQSAADSGYSVDNLPPLPPAPFAGTYAAGTATLHWGPNREVDLAGYRLYRGASASFTPSPGNLVAAKPDTGYVDVAGGAFVYKLSAVDSHGNESAFVTLAPAGVLGVGPAPARVLALLAPVPNPARGAASITYTLSRGGSVRLSLYDASGRRVQVLADGVQDAGEYRVSLELRDASRGALPAGLYWVRLEAEGRALTRRLLTLR